MLIFKNNITSWRALTVSKLIWTTYNKGAQNLSNMGVCLRKPVYINFSTTRTGLVAPIFLYLVYAWFTKCFVTRCALFAVMNKIETYMTGQHFPDDLFNWVSFMHWINTLFSFGFILFTFTERNPCRCTFVLFGPNTNTFRINLELGLLVLAKVYGFKLFRIILWL